VELNGTRFGTVVYEEQDVLSFDSGLIGFPGPIRFVILHHKPESPFRWLQSLEDPSLAFLVADPAPFVPDYDPVVPIDQLRELSPIEETPRMVLTTVRIPHQKPEETTVNLAAPLVIDAVTRKGKQVVLEDGAYTMRHRVFDSPNREEAPIAA
jgi:flagellar assembly factor FliW